MPSLNNDNDIGITISTKADNSGIDAITSATGSMVDKFQDGMKKVSLVTGAAGVALTAFAKSSIDYLTDLAKSSKALSQQTGMTIEQSSTLLAVLERMGITASNTSVAFRTFSKQINDSQSNTSANALATQDMNNKIAAAKIQVSAITEEIRKHGDSTGALTNKVQGLNIQIEGYKQNLQSAHNVLDQLNVSTKNADGSNKDFNSILSQVADRFKEMPDGAKKTADAVALFGRSGTQMIKVLDLGSAGIQQLETNAQKLGLTLTAQNIGVIQNYIASQKKLADSTNATKIAVGTLSAPIMTKFNDILSGVIQKLTAANSPFKTLTVDVLAFGGPVLGATSAVAAFLGNIGSAIPVIIALRNSLIFGAVFDAIKVGVATLQLVTFPSMIASIRAVSLTWTAAFPVAGILADIALVTAAIDSVLAAKRAVDDAYNASTSAETSQVAAINKIKQAYTEGKITKDQEVKYLSAQNRAPSSGYASGTNSAAGGSVLVGEQGPERVDLPRGSVVHDAKRTTRMQSGTTNHFHGDIILGDSSAVNSFFKKIDQDGILASKGLTTSRGTS